MTIALTLTLSFSFVSSIAQDEMKTLFGNGDKDVSLSGFGAVINEFSAVDGDFAFLMGGGGAMLFNQKYFFGAYGMGLTTRHTRKFSIYNDNPEEPGAIETPLLYTRFGHGGLWLGYIYNPQKAINWGANVKVGWGSITLSEYTGSDYNWAPYESDNVFVLTPELNMGLNLLKWMRVNVGVGYRLVTGVDNTYTGYVDGHEVSMEYFDSNAFSNFEGSVTLAFGWFSN